ncbi:eukaryotic translation initiation factor 3 subunit J [Culicoides brevitarsis]|uniref:eukaryotic translation initiation factor 3 subunit J n=1 Tax=Culicoides brevitarsis TaxID=469753 RepID=UPI00307C764C
MEDDWEALADSSKVVKPKPVNVNKWDGEDIEEDVKDSWEDEDEEEDSKKDSNDSTPVKTKPKKTLQQKIAEKERARLEEIERKRREKEEAEMTPEQRLAEKARIQKLQEENDLKLALETFGLTDAGATGGIDARNPQTVEEFTELADAISKKVLQFKLRDEFPNFAEELVRNICASMTSTHIRKIKTTVDNMYLEKQKLEKGDKPKKKGGKVKAKLRVEGENSRLDDLSTQYDYDEMDDFM